MKRVRMIIYIVILAGLLFAPTKPLRMGHLLPVEVVSVRKEGKWTLIETDTGHKGMGRSGQEALENLKATADGIIYLDTARFLLMNEEGAEAVEQLRGMLRKSVKLCIAQGQPDLKKAGQYLQIHGNLPALKQWVKGVKLPVLSAFENSFIFLKKVENNA